MATLDRFEKTPGSVGQVPDRWPSASRIVRETGRPTLVAFLHARCTCSWATVAELAAIATATHGALALQVVFLDPLLPDGSQAPPGLWARAAAIPGVTLARDETGAEARRFGAETSGQTLLYDAGGVLRFAGGVTAGRGVEGDSAGRETIVALVERGTEPRVAALPAFGCALQDPPAPREVASR